MKKIALVTFVSLIIHGSVFGQKESPSVKYSDYVPLTPQGRKQALSKLERERKFQIIVLMEIMKYEGTAREKKGELGLWPDDVECIAIRMLGELRAVEAVDLLLDRIDVRTERIGSELFIFADADGFVVDALQKIGKPSSIKAIEYLAKDKSSERAKMYVRVITLVEGVDIGKEMVRLAIEKEMDPQKKERLQKALPLFKLQK